MKGDLILEAADISAGYGAGGSRDDVIHGISFTLREGERLCVLGPNGSGKTTLLRVIAGTLPYRGRLRLTVRDPATPARGQAVERSRLGFREAARETGLLSQISGSYFPFRVEETVLLGRYARQKPLWTAGPTREDREAVAAAMAACGVSDIGDRSLSSLSGGQLQRVFLARALAQDPTTILLDEPTNHLDLFYQMELLRMIDAWTSRAGKAAIGVFHDLSLAFRFADTALLLDGGRVAAYGSAREVLKSGALNRAYRMDVAATLRDLLQSW